MCLPQLWTDYNTLLVNLCVADLLIGIFGIPVDWLASVRGGWDQGAVQCILTGFLLTLFGKVFLPLGKIQLYLVGEFS